MTTWQFPETRFAEAGVDPAIIDTMRREFAEGDLSIQRAKCEFWQSQSVNGLRDYAARYDSESSETTPDAPQTSESDLDVSDDDESTGDDTDDPDASLD